MVLPKLSYRILSTPQANQEAVFYQCSGAILFSKYRSELVFYSASTPYQVRSFLNYLSKNSFQQLVKKIRHISFFYRPY